MTNVKKQSTHATERTLNSRRDDGKSIDSARRLKIIEQIKKGKFQFKTKPLQSGRIRYKQLPATKSYNMPLQVKDTTVDENVLDVSYKSNTQCK